MKIKDKEYEVRRHKLKAWIELEEIWQSLRRAADAHSIAHALLKYVSAAFCVSVDEIADAPWYEIADAVVAIRHANEPGKRFAILFNQGDVDRDSESDAFDYEGRLWYLWCHMFAFTYGWDISVIENLEIDDAIGLLQEIAIQRQYDREWEWSLSDIAYDYNPHTKKSEYRALPRPRWMMAKGKKVEKSDREIKIPKHMIPVGIIVRGKSDITQ